MWFCENLYTALPIMNSNESVIISDHEKLGSKIWAVAKSLHIESFNEIMEEISDLLFANVLKIDLDILHQMFLNPLISVNTVLLPNTMQQLQSVIDKCHNQMVYQANESVFEVKSNNDNFRVVDLTLSTCTCQ
ncbi:19979_t:CDS:2 [Dentiscutata erythropus]|uniref:19979_t:CDS:1 n=1 Tax=Dentiscutata erythropus TaxID=1348616 RepID=A0A9N9H1I2_9GLOM|nr:19979_t:CDS:2 [Dentiscutata erythropus]